MVFLPNRPKALEPAVWRTLHAAATGPEDLFGAGFFCHPIPGDPKIAGEWMWIPSK